MRPTCSLLLVLTLSGCADASERFQAFEARRGTLEGDAGAPGLGGADGAGGASCAPPAPGVVHGPALLALETTTSPGLPIMFLGEVTTPELDGRTAVKFSYKAVDALDRQTKVGKSLLVGPYPIEADGRFDAPTSKSTLPGEANAILRGVEITTQLTLHGTICGVATFYCGTVTGTVYSPYQGPTSGRFGLTLLPSEQDIPERPQFGCEENALAPALADAK